MQIMRKMIFFLIPVLLGLSHVANAQSYEVQQLILDWEKLAQLKNILKDMYKGYEIVEKGYTTIRDISHGNFDLHKAFLDGLLSVSPVVKQYYKVAEIIQDEAAIVREYKSAYSRFKADPHFTADEISYIGKVFDQLFDQTLKNLNDLVTVLTDGQLRASDDERLRQIDALHTDMRAKLLSLRRFNNQTTMLSMQRSRDLEDVNQVKNLYGLP